MIEPLLPYATNERMTTYWRRSFQPSIIMRWITASTYLENQIPTDLGQITFQHYKRLYMMQLIEFLIVVSIRQNATTNKNEQTT